MNPFAVCIFCLTCHGNLKAGSTCTYGYHHEFVEELKVQQKKVETKLCLTCGLHPNNPKSKNNDCNHSYQI